MKTLVALALVACSSPTTTPSEQPDAAAPPSVDADLHGDVHVTVIDPVTGNLAAGSRVVVQDASGVQTVTLDDHGRATARVLPDASVTAIVGSEIMTVLAAQPGDDLLLGAFDDFSEVGTFTVNFSTTDANSYDVYGPCGSEHVLAPPAVLTIQRNCEVDTMDLIVVARDATGAGFAAAEATNVPFAVGGSVHIPAPSTNPIAFDEEYTHTDDVSAIQVARGQPDGFGLTNSGNATISVDDARIALVSFPSQHALVTNVFSSASHPDSKQELIVDDPAPQLGLDVANALLPWIDSVTIANDVVTIAPAPSADFVVTRVIYTHGGATLDWFVMGPPSAQITLPAIDVAPAPGDSITLVVVAIDTDAVTDYASVRAKVFTLFDQLAHTHRLPAGTHRFRASTITVAG